MAPFESKSKKTINLVDVRRSGEYADYVEMPPKRERGTTCNNRQPSRKKAKRNRVKL